MPKPILIVKNSSSEGPAMNREHFNKTIDEVSNNKFTENDKEKIRTIILEKNYKLTVDNTIHGFTY